MLTFYKSINLNQSVNFMSHPDDHMLITIIRVFLAKIESLEACFKARSSNSDTIFKELS